MRCHGCGKPAKDLYYGYCDDCCDDINNARQSRKRDRLED